MATAASSDYCIEPVAGVQLYTAHSGTATNPFPPGHTIRVGKNKVALRIRVDYDASGIASTASASITVTVSAGTWKAQASGVGHTLLAQDGTASSGTFAWVIGVGDTDVAE